MEPMNPKPLRWRLGRYTKASCNAQVSIAILMSLFWANKISHAVYTTIRNKKLLITLLKCVDFGPRGLHRLHDHPKQETTAATVHASNCLTKWISLYQGPRVNTGDQNIMHVHSIKKMRKGRLTPDTKGEVVMFE